MLTAIMDCLVQSELECFIKTLRRDGFLCLSADTSIDTLHDDICQHSARPIVIYGPDSLHVPYDDCPRLWLCCGPEVDHDMTQAPLRGAVTEDDLARRATAVRSDYHFVTYVEAMCIMADAVAKQNVNSMGMGDKAADIILRHVQKPTF
jgi:hypothetical protein